MSAETQEFISTLLLEFRNLVLGIQEEQRELKQKLRELPGSGTHTIATASPTDEPLSTTTTISSGTLSGNTLATGSTKPPSYKSIVRPQVVPPKPPARTRKRVISGTTTITTTTTTTSSSTNMSGPELTRGALIVLEGLDRVGKSTLCKKLVEHLERIRKPVSFCRFPERTTPVGQVINDFLKNNSKKVDDHTMHLLFSANRWEMNKRIRTYLTKGTTVIVDRYSYSGIAYSSAKKGLTMEWCRDSEKGLPKPDLVIYLELPKEAQYKREGFGDERFETKEMQELIRYQYEKLMEMTHETWLRIDVENKSPDQVLGEVIVPVKRCIESSAHKEVGDLDFI